MQFLLKLIRPIWLVVLLAMSSAALPILASAARTVPISFAYDGQNQTSTAYDEEHTSPVFDYDSDATCVASEKEIGAAKAGRLFADFSKFLAAKTVSLDNNALIAGIENGNAAGVDAAIAGRTPIISRQVVREFLGKGDVDALRQFLSQRGGRVGLSGTEAEVQALQVQAASMGRRLGIGDARVAGSAAREGTPVITNDKGFRNFLNQAGIGGEGF
jgi:predicted nucleic acid-binding protein